MLISESERTAIVAALRLAADVYQQDADNLNHKMEVPRVAEAFERQAQNAMSLADSIEQDDDRELEVGPHD